MVLDVPQPVPAGCCSCGVASQGLILHSGVCFSSETAGMKTFKQEKWIKYWTLPLSSPEASTLSHQGFHRVAASGKTDHSACWALNKAIGCRLPPPEEQRRGATFAALPGHAQEESSSFQRGCPPGRRRAKQMGRGLGASAAPESCAHRAGEEMALPGLRLGNTREQAPQNKPGYCSPKAK